MADEQRHAKRHGRIKIEAPFEKVLRAALEVKPPEKPKRKPSRKKPQTIDDDPRR